MNLTTLHTQEANWSKKMIVVTKSKLKKRVDLNQLGAIRYQLYAIFVFKDQNALCWVQMRTSIVVKKRELSSMFSDVG